MIAVADSSCFEQAPALNACKVPSQTGSEHRYSVTALTDTTGAVVERYGYDAYGNMTVLSADGLTVRAEAMQPYGTTGRRFDDETGLWYFRARYYDAELGRFVGRDPLGYVDGHSMYRGYYVPGGMDPWGLFYILRRYAPTGK